MTKLEQSMLTDFYDKRYEKDAYNLTCISDDESSHIKNMLYSIQKSKLSTNADKKIITLIDYGCGDGRLHPLYEEIAQEVLGEDFILKVIGIDPSQSALSIYREKCNQSGYKVKSDNGVGKLWEIGEGSDNYIIGKRNVEVCLFCADIGILNNLKALNWHMDFIVSAGVTCHVLGRDNRKNILNAFKMASSSLFLSQPTNEDFSSIQRNFHQMREEKKIIQKSIKDLSSSDGDVSLLQKKLLHLNENLKDAQEDGEIYYSAGWVRRLADKLPEYKDLKIPYFGTTVELAKRAVEEVGYKFVTSRRATFGCHKRWIVTLASDLFEVEDLDHLVDTWRTED
jgi:SAM-dependent methyltransferase